MYHMAVIKNSLKKAIMNENSYLMIKKWNSSSVVKKEQLVPDD